MVRGGRPRPRPLGSRLRGNDGGGSPLWFQYGAPLTGIVFLLVCLRVWEFGVRRYMSTGS